MLYDFYFLFFNVENDCIIHAKWSISMQSFSEFPVVFFLFSHCKIEKRRIKTSPSQWKGHCYSYIIQSIVSRESVDMSLEQRTPHWMDGGGGHFLSRSNNPFHWLTGKDKHLHTWDNSSKKNASFVVIYSTAMEEKKNRPGHRQNFRPVWLAEA